MQNRPVTPPINPSPRESFKRKILEIRDETVDVETSQEWFEEVLKIMGQALLSKLNSADNSPSVESLNLFLKGWEIRGSGKPRELSCHDNGDKSSLLCSYRKGAGNVDLPDLLQV